MIVIRVASEDVPDLKILLTEGGVPYTIGTEDRYFGDNDLVSVILDAVKDLSILSPLLTAFLAKNRRKTINIDGVDIVVSNPITDSEKDLIRKALS